MAVKVVRRRVARKRATKLRKTSKRMGRPRKRVTRKTLTGSKRKVWNGTKMYTRGGLMKKDLCVNKRGHAVSKKQMSHGKKAFRGWLKALKKARKVLGLKKFVACKKGTKLYFLAKELYG